MRKERERRKGGRESRKWEGEGERSCEPDNLKNELCNTNTCTYKQASTNTHM